jgi:hypothetical protein
LIAVLLLAAGCTATEQPVVERPPAIQPPFAELIPSFDEYMVNATEGDTITTASGTRIILPSGALLDDSGKVVTGEVKIKYREYHDALDVFLSGIPMDYMSQGQQRVMQTAGMFEIRAEQDGRELTIAAGKEVEVGFASNEAGPDYNFFQFDETKEEWAFVDYSEPVVNPKKEEIKTRIKNMKKVTKVPFDKNHFVLNYSSFIDVYYNDDYKKVRKNRNNPKMLKKASKYGLKMYNVINAGKVIFKGRSYPAQLMVWNNLSGRDFPKWTSGLKCRSDYIGKNRYRFTVTDRKSNKSIMIEAECVMLLRDLFKSSSKKWAKEYLAYQEELVEEEKRYALEAAVFRTVELSGFGIFNYDKLQKRENTVAVNSYYKIIGQSEDERFGAKFVFCFLGDDRTMIKLRVGSTNKLYLDAQDKNFRMLTVIQGNRIAVFTAEQYRKIDFEALSKAKTPFYTFALKAQDQVISSKSDLKSLLKI